MDQGIPPVIVGLLAGGVLMLLLLIFDKPGRHR